MSWSHRLRMRLLDWQARRLLSKINRPYKQSDAMMGVPGDASMLSTILKMCGIVACLLVVGFIYNN